MSDDPRLEQAPIEGAAAGDLESPVPAPDDPGGAHSKGYSADPTGAAAVDVPEQGPIPLADGPVGQVHVPERDAHVRPTGRDEQGEYGPNDR